MNAYKPVNSERDLVDNLIIFLNNNNYKTKIEIPNMGQSVDIVAQKGDQLTFIEAKLKNWRRAIEQCEAHEHIADYICIALSKTKITNLIIEKLIFLGYGLIDCEAATGLCEWILKPSLMQNIWKPQRRIFLKNLNEIIHDRNFLNH